MLLRRLLDTLGIDQRRVHFTWISAAEGKKWQEVVSELTQTTRELGPYRAYRQICEVQP
jgi:coenzyme F420-reducing hydrogenase delta subunit